MAHSRRRLLALAAAGAASGLAGCGTDDPGDGTPTPSTATDAGTASDPATAADTDLPAAIGLETIVDGLRAPLDVAFAAGGDRRYLAEQQGVVHVLEDGGLGGTPFLDLRDAVTTGGEKGLLGIALHPDYAENRRLFVRYSAPARSGTPDDYSHTFVLAEFRAGSAGRRVDPATERTLLTVPQPQGNHNAGGLAFGPDGFLHVAVGDGGAAGDEGPGHVDDWYDAVPGGNGQDVTENLLGSVLRIDVDGGGEGGYAVPGDNPLVGRPGLDEQYAWGLRNPYRMAFDDGRLFVADVGQNSFEEVDLVESGGNYGWNVREGTHCYRAADCPDRTPDGVRGGEPLREPIFEYPRADAPVSGISVIGGQVYRGSALPSLSGRYVFGDLRVDGRLFVATPPADGRTWSTDVLPLADGDAGRLERLLSVGRGPDGEVYALGTGEGGGGLHRVRPVE
ncbi:sugar dehydrogenase [Halobacteriales archaeon QH_7_69_31]|nr:MAG: sugar dehydrogenase [Halobacteriales archaeon QH_7_69_31]